VPDVHLLGNQSAIIAAAFGLAIVTCAARIKGQVAPGIGANTEDPKKVLRAADEALRAVRSVSYSKSSVCLTHSHTSRARSQQHF